MTTLITITEDQFEATYPLLPNHLNPHASWNDGEGPGFLFETYGRELDFVRNQDPRTVWTLLDGENGELIVRSGYRFVNRLGYLISTTPFPDDIEIQFLASLPAATSALSEFKSQDAS